MQSLLWVPICQARVKGSIPVGEGRMGTGGPPGILRAFK